MKSIYLTFIAFFIFSTSHAQQWENLGDFASFEMTEAHGIVVPENGKPIAGYFSTNTDFYLVQWNNNSWDTLSYQNFDYTSDFQFVNIGNIFYVGRYDGDAGAYKIDKYQSGSWTSLPNVSTFNSRVGTWRLATSNTTNDLSLSYLDDDFPSQPHIYYFNGTNWTSSTNLASHFDYTGNGEEAYSSEITTFGGVSYMLMLENMGFGGEGQFQNPNQFQTRAMGTPDLRLHRWDEQSDSWALVTGNFIVEQNGNPININMTSKATNGDPYLVYYEEVIHDLHVLSANSSSITPLTTFTNNDEIQSVNSTVNELNNPVIALTDLSGNKVIQYNGSDWDAVGTEVDAQSINKLDVEVFKAGNKIYVAYNSDGGSGVKVFNNPPTFFALVSNNTLCLNSPNSVIAGDLRFSDMDNDEVTIVDISSDNQTLISDANLTSSRIGAYNYNSSNNRFNISGFPNNNESGTANIEVRYTDGFDTLAHTFVLTVNAPPTLTLPPLTEVCLNNGPLNLNGIATPIGGSYSGDFIGNNTFNPLNAGVGTFTYEYNYTDANGCSNMSSSTIEVLDIPVTSLNITNATCGESDGSVSAAITGGASPYTQHWSNGETSTSISAASPGNYYINVTDLNGCYVMDVATVTSNEVTLTGTANGIDCFGDSDGSVDLTVNGSNGPYIYFWSNGKTTEDISNLVPGQYEVFVTDINNCTSTMSFNVNGPTPLTANTSSTNTTGCGTADGSLSAIGVGGTAPYSFDWLDNSGGSVGASDNLTNISGGIYSVNVLDSKGCSTIANEVVSEAGAPIITLQSVTSATCDNDGAINVEISTNNTLTSRVWSNSATTEDISSLSPGYYTLTVEDNLGCQANFGTEVYPAYPEINEICMVSVDTNTNTNLVIWEKPISTEIDYFIVYRETSVAGQFLPVDSIGYDEESLFTDPIAYPQIRSWRYKLGVVNNCGIESAPSPAHKTIHNTISNGLSGSFNINWDAYEGFTYSTFDLYRYTDLNGWELIQSLPSNTYSFTDTPPSEVGLDYIISITPPNVCTSTTTKAQDHNASRSNKSSSVTPPGGPNTNNVEETDFSNGITIYPNPSSSFYNVYLNTQINETYQVNIYDMKGAIVKTFNSNQTAFIVQLSGFDVGMYILEIATENEVVRKQLIKK
jgi:hypothetical protein